MKIIKSSLLILLCLVLVSTFFAACGGKKNNESTVSIDFSTTDINFVDAEGDAAYRVVRTAANDDLTPYASIIIKAIYGKFNVATKNVTDAEEEGDYAEIVIGDTNREVTKKAKLALSQEATGRHNDFVICTIGNDIAIYGQTLEATIKAIEYFAETYVTGEVITGGIHYVFSNKDSYKDITICDTTLLSKFKAVRPIYNVSYLVQSETEALLKYLCDTTGYIIEQTDDNIASTTGNMTDGSGTLTKSEPTEYEIIIGNCNRDGVKAFTNYDAYEIRVEGKKIFLNGGSAHATAMAVSEFKKLLKSNDKITADINVLNGDYNSVIDNYDRADYYRPTWGDDFDGEDINYDIWNVGWDIMAGYSKAPNGKTQYRSSTKHKNTYVKDGLLYQVAIETSDAYYGGWMDTDKIMNYRYGYIELSTIHPKGMGFWTALWNVSHLEQYPEYSDYYYNSEVDIEECYGNGTWAYGNTFCIPTPAGKIALDIPTNLTGMVHVNNKVSCKDDRGFYMDFHTFGFEWNGNTNVKYTCDGYVYAEQDLRDGAEKATFEIPQVVQLSLACGSGNHGTPTTDPIEWTKYNKYIIDWVKLYQKKGQRLYNWNKDSKSWYIAQE